MKINKTTQLKIYENYVKTIGKIGDRILYTNQSKENRDLITPLVCDMLNEFTEFIMDNCISEIDDKQHVELNNIINSGLLGISAIIDDYIPTQEDVVFVLVTSGKMVLKANRKILKNGKQ